ncbi:MAG TPA: nitronate monooxygenase [Polyangiaceae bacterium]|nr:nitronate monooxygenase [Polyangiaceae bacterium]
MSSVQELPRIIQGGMGVAVSNWRLARAVAEVGGLGVVSGTALDTVLIRRLQLGDDGGHVRVALEAFPFAAIAQRVIAHYFVTGGVDPRAPFRLASLPNEHPKFQREALYVLGAFVEVYLAKLGHSGLVGINLLEKIQLPTLPTLFGAMLAGVDVVLMGAGIPLAIPGVLDAFARLQATEIKLHVEQNEAGRVFTSRFDPAAFIAHCLEEEARSSAEGAVGGRELEALARPAFLAIVSSHILAKTLHKKATGRVDGFVVEGHVAGGHNAPPRKKSAAAAEPIPTYGPADAPELEPLRELGVPFWLAGGFASAEKLREAIALGARGIQVGTVFAYCDESGIAEDVKRRVIAGCRAGTLRVETDFEASPTGYPFKLLLDAQHPGEREQLRARERICDLGYLRQAFVDERGQLAFRCPGEPVDTYLKKGGTIEATKNKLCLCNGLLATVGLGQRRTPEDELPMLTVGEGFREVLAYLPANGDSYSARDVMTRLLTDFSSAAE